ncbi:hypothetical protein BFP97_10020 [Roseivirga sp. 4D4]|nr:hypothetical protein BFP97_10020 [Roseivirga sp. 4D4]
MIIEIEAFLVFGPSKSPDFHKKGKKIMFLGYRSMNPLQQFQIKPVNLEISIKADKPISNPLALLLNRVYLYDSSRELYV